MVGDLLRMLIGSSHFDYLYGTFISLPTRDRYVSTPFVRLHCNVTQIDHRSLLSAALGT